MVPLAVLWMPRYLVRSPHWFSMRCTSTSGSGRKGMGPCEIGKFQSVSSGQSEQQAQVKKQQLQAAHWHGHSIQPVQSPQQRFGCITKGRRALCRGLPLVPLSRTTLLRIRCEGTYSL